MDILKLAAKFLPPKAQAILTQLAPLLKEPQFAQDLTTALTEIQSEIAKFKGSATLKAALADMYEIAEIAKGYIKKGDVSLGTVFNIGVRKGAFQRSAEALADAFKAKDAEAMAFAEKLKNNATLYEAVKRIVARGNNSFFTLEDLTDGSGNAVELMSGNQAKLHLGKDDYQEVKKALAPKKPGEP